MVSDRWVCGRRVNDSDRMSWIGRVLSDVLLSLLQYEVFAAMKKSTLCNGVISATVLFGWTLLSINSAQRVLNCTVHTQYATGHHVSGRQCNRHGMISVVLLQ